MLPAVHPFGAGALFWIQIPKSGCPYRGELCEVIAMLHRRHFLIATAASSIGLVARAAEQRIRDVRTISVLPSAANDIKNLHEQSRGYSAELVPENEPLEVKTFSPYLTKRDETDAEKRLPNVCCRRHALSVGLEMLTDDKNKLPRLSGGEILSYLKSHFVSVQARVYREPVSRSLYLGPRCMATTRKFQGSTLTEAFFPTVAESVGNMRSLGLLLPAKAQPTPSNLRTLVLVHKNQLSQEVGRISVPKLNYEYLFIRAQEAGSDRLKLHAFATSDERTKFHWLRVADSPSTPSDCSIRGAVHFTEYSHQGLYPKSAIVRRSLISGQKTFDWDSVDKFARKTYGQSALENMTQVLDAIIAGEIRESLDVLSTQRR